MRIKMALSVASILVTQNLLLANETTKLDDVQVVTSASGYEQKITDAPASISVITQEELKKKKYSNLAEAIEDVEASSAFWHMCDLIWLLLFPVLYLIF